MSKMRMPEMNVVRFTESDVIVASGLYHVEGATDTIGKSLTITNPRGETIFTNYQRGHDIDYMAPYGGLGVQFYYTNGSPYDLDFLVQADSREKPDSLTGVDGDYTWNGSFFEKYGLQ